ncbi:MAG TPA: thiosulfate oxidation carrier complex protein SoxZ [Burkholderiales bacterium]|nr:thiosulfate oxidation carrier complex protein SoxZ [Burkholderiales bacterium]
MAEPIRMRVKLEGGVAEVRVLIGHPMETGLRKDPKSGELVPLHFIKSVVATLNGKPVLAAQWSQAVSRNPYMQFRVKGAKPDDEIGIEWVDSRGESNRASAKVPAAG